MAAAPSGLPPPAGPVPLLVGVSLLRDTAVELAAGPAWPPALLAGGLVLVLSLRSERPEPRQPPRSECARGILSVAGDLVVVKSTWSAFHSTSLDADLRIAPGFQPGNRPSPPHPAAESWN